MEDSPIQSQAALLELADPAIEAKLRARAEELEQRAAHAEASRAEALGALAALQHVRGLPGGALAS
jgi:hypothetical protein